MAASSRTHLTYDVFIRDLYIYIFFIMYGQVFVHMLLYMQYKKTPISLSQQLQSSRTEIRSLLKNIYVLGIFLLQSFYPIR